MLEGAGESRQIDKFRVVAVAFDPVSDLFVIWAELDDSADAFGKPLPRTLRHAWTLKTVHHPISQKLVFNGSMHTQRWSACVPKISECRTFERQRRLVLFR